MAKKKKKKGWPSRVHLFLLEWKVSYEKRKESQTQEAVATADLTRLLFCRLEGRQLGEKGRETGD